MADLDRRALCQGLRRPEPILAISIALQGLPYRAYVSDLASTV